MLEKLHQLLQVMPLFVGEDFEGPLEDSIQGSDLDKALFF